MYGNAIDKRTQSGYLDETGGYQGQSLGQCFQDIYRASRGDGIVSEALLATQREARAAGMGEGVGSEGGFLLPENFAGGLIGTVWDEPDILAQINKMTISVGNNLKLPAINETSRADGYRSGGLEMKWAGEGTTKTDTRPDIRQNELVLKKIYGLLYVTDELLEDAPLLDQHIRKCFNSELYFKLVNGLIRGTGAGMPLGILAAPCLVTQVIETGQATSTIVVENIVNMWSRLIPSAARTATWHCSSNVLPQLLTMGITVGVGGSPLFMPANALAGQPFNTILGRPLIPIEQCPTLGAVGDLILASWPNYLGLDKKDGAQAATSIHVRFLQDETAFRFVYRFDGQPELEAAVTPYNGGDTLSHFVTLAARP